MSVTIRQLGPEDAGDLRALNVLFAAAFEDDAHYLGAPASDDHVARLLGKPQNIVLTANVDGVLAGGIVAYELEKFEQARSEIYIYDLAVAEAQRRQGVATALIERLQTMAAQRGAWVVYVQADHGDDPAIALYTKLGSREDVMHFDIPVPPTR